MAFQLRKIKVEPGPSPVGRGKIALSDGLAASYGPEERSSGNRRTISRKLFSESNWNKGIIWSGSDQFHLKNSGYTCVSAMFLIKSQGRMGNGKTGKRSIKKKERDHWTHCSQQLTADTRKNCNLYKTGIGCLRRYTQMKEVKCCWSEKLNLTDDEI